MKQLAIIILLTLVSCGGGKTTYANDVQIYAVNVVGKYSVSEADFFGRDGFYEVVTRFKEDADTNLSLYKYEEVEAPKEPWVYDMNSQGRKLSWCKNYHDGIKVPNNTIFYCIFPPIIEPDGKRYAGGMAWVGSFRSKYLNVAMGQAQAWSSHNPPRPRLDAAFRITMSHEIGHVLGAHHMPETRCVETPQGEQCNYNGPNIMEPAAGCYADTHYRNLFFLPFSGDEIIYTVTGANRRRVRSLRRKAAKASGVKKRRILRRIKRVQTGKAASAAIEDEAFE